MLPKLRSATPAKNSSSVYAPDAASVHNNALDLAAMEAAGQDTAAFVEADLGFHLAVASAGQSGLLEQLYYLSRKLLSKVITDWVKQPGVKEESIRIQRAIAQAIEQRDPHRAREAALDHMTYIGRLLEAS